MAKTIGIKLNFTSTGEQKVINNLADLEKELQFLQTQIKTLDFGSKAFEEAARNIAILKSRIDEVDKATEGIGAEKKYRALGDAINVATGSFQVLSGILGLVITQEEDLEQVQRAEAAALQVVNVALGINAINTALVESATLRATLATKAQTIATNIASKAQALWNAILLANPIGLVVAGVLALTGVIYGLVKAYDALFSAEAQQAKELKDIQRLENSLLADRKKATQQLEDQLEILTDNVKTRNLEKKTLEDLKKTFPGLNAFIDRNNQLTKEGIEFLKLKIKLQQAEVVLQKVREQKADAEIEYETELNKLQTEGVGIGQQIVAGLTKTNPVLNKITDLTIDYTNKTKALNAVEEKYIKLLDEGLLAITPYEKKLAAQVKLEENLAKGGEKNNNILDSRTRFLLAQNRLLQEAIENYSILNAVELKYTADILKKQEEILSGQEELLKGRADSLTTASSKLAEELNTLLRKTIPTPNQFQELTDNYQTLFDTIADAYLNNEELLSQPLPFEGLISAANLERQKQGLSLFGEELSNLSEDSKNALVDYFNLLRNRVDEVRNIPFFADQEDLVILQKLSKVEDEIFEITTKRLQEGKTELEVQQEITDLINREFGFQLRIEENNKSINEEKKKGEKANQLTIDALTKQNEELEKNRDLIIEGVDKSVEFYQGVVVVGEQAAEKTKKIAENATKLAEKLSPEQFSQLKQIFKDNIDQFDTLVLDILNNFDDYIKKVGEDGVAELLGLIGDELDTLDNVSRKTLENLLEVLKTQQAIKKAAGEDTTALDALIDDVSKKLRQLPTDAREAFEKALDDIDDFANKFVNQLSKIASKYQNLIQSQSSLLLEQLASDEARALDAVEGTTTRLQKEQEKIRKEFAKTRFEVEKQARITELRFTLAQTISDSALAITNTLASVPTPFNIPLAATIGALSAAQVLQVRNQLTFAQSQQFVGRRGGLITGQSHEGSNGGVPALLEGGEFVVNRAAVAQYGDLIGELNSATGGRKLAIDDSRLVQTIAKQNQNTPPLKAYVLYNDIQSTDKLNSRITKLARL